MASEAARRIERHLEQEEKQRFIAQIARLKVWPKLTDFSDCFSPEEIKRDQATVDRAKASFGPEEKERRELSKAMEVLISEMVENHDWLGKSVYLTPTTEYDDMVNPYIRADAVAEVELKGEEVKHMALSLDATVATRSLTMRDKIYGNIARVLSTDPLRVKYFRSQRNEHKGPIDEAIPIVVGLDQTNLKEVASLFLQLARLAGKMPTGSVPQSSEFAIKERRRLLAEIPKHPAQLVFLHEIKIQLELFRDGLTKLNEPGLKARLAQVKRILEYIDQTLQEKREIGIGHFQDDGVMREINDEIKQYRSGH